jgi:hypothetical protein
MGRGGVHGAIAHLEPCGVGLWRAAPLAGLVQQDYEAASPDIAQASPVAQGSSQKAGPRNRPLMLFVQGWRRGARKRDL